MALTRKLLKGMGLTEEQVDTIIEAHTETVDGLKTDLKAAQESAKQSDALKKRSETAEKELEDAKKDGWKDKHDQVKKEFDDYKAEQANKETRAAKEKAYRELLKAAGISEKRMDSVMKVTNLDSVELEDGKVKDSASVTENIKREWADFIVQTNSSGANTPNPPANNGGNPKTKAEIMAIQDRSERRAAIAANMNLFKGDK